MRNTVALIAAVLACTPYSLFPQAQTKSSTADPAIVRATAGTALYFDLTPDGRSIIIDLLGQLWEVPVGGGAATPITNAVRDAADDRQPAISPDGQWIAARSDRAAGRGIWLHARTGKSARALTDSATILGGDVGVPAWSPSGARIAYTHDGGIMMLDVATGRRERLQIPDLGNGSFDEPVWSPDGSHMLVTGPWSGGSARALLDGPFGAPVWEIDITTRKARKLTAEGVTARAPSYAPDGRSIAYFVGDSTRTYRLMVRFLEEAPVMVSAQPGIEPRRVRWSRDGASLIFVANGGLRRIAAAGGASVELPFVAELRVPRTRYTRIAPPMPDAGASVAARGFKGVAFAPDGKSIGVLALGKLWLVDLEGRTRSLATTLTSAKGLTWSPDGTRVAWSGGALSMQDMWVTDVRTGTSRQVSHSAGSDARAAWSPDGRWIAYMHNDNSVHVVDANATSDSAESKGPKIPFSEVAAFGQSLNWTPAGDTLLIYGMDNWPVARRGCVTAKLIPLSGEPQTINRFPCRPSHVTLGSDGTLYSIEDGVVTERKRTSDGWADPHRVGTEAALYTSTSRDGKLLFVTADGLRVRNSSGAELKLGWPIKFTAPSAPPMIVRNVRIVPIDPAAGGRAVDASVKDSALQDILIVNGRIAEIARAGLLQSRVAAPSTLDAAGAWAIPGLIDAHTHFISTGLAQARGELYHGVTTVREMWGALSDGAAWRDNVAAGVSPGSRIVVSGPPVYPAPTIPGVTSDFLWIPVDSATTDRGLTMLRAFGAGHVKMRYTQSWNAAGAFLRRAHAFGFPVGGHCAHGIAAVSAGIDTHEHADGQCGDWEFGIHDDIVQLYRAADVAVVPIIDLHDEVARTASDTLVLQAPDVLPFRAGVRAMSTNNARALSRLRQRAAKVRAATNMFYRGGVRLAAGADAETLPGGVPREIETLVAAGLPPSAALSAATSSAARVLGLEREIGMLAAGLRADIVLLDADPLQDIRNVRRIRTIIQDGRVIERAKLLDPVETHF